MRPVPRAPLRQLPRGTPVHVRDVDLSVPHERDRAAIGRGGGVDHRPIPRERRERIAPRHPLCRRLDPQRRAAPNHQRPAAPRVAKARDPLRPFPRPFAPEALFQRQRGRPAAGDPAHGRAVGRGQIEGPQGPDEGIVVVALQPEQRVPDEPVVDGTAVPGGNERRGTIERERVHFVLVCSGRGALFIWVCSGRGGPAPCLSGFAPAAADQRVWIAQRCPRRGSDALGPASRPRVHHLGGR